MAKIIDYAVLCVASGAIAYIAMATLINFLTKSCLN